MIKRVVKEFPYIIAILFLVYILVSFIEVNMYNLSEPDLISEYNLFNLIVQLNER